MTSPPPPSFPTQYDPRPHAALIPAPVAVILLCDSSHERAHTAAAAFERELFLPGTPANDLYQLFNDWSWEGILLAIAVFPGEHLPRLEAIVEEHGLYLLEGTPKAIVKGRISTYDPEAEIRKVLGIEVGKVCTIHTSPEFFNPTNVRVF